MNNIDAIREKFDGYGIDALLLTTEANRFYMSGFQATDGLALVTREDAYVFVDSRYIEAAEAAVTGAQVLLVDRENTYKTRVKAALSNLNCRAVGFEDGSMSVAEYRKYSEDIIELPMLPATKLLGELRASKNAGELESLIAAQRIAERALTSVLKLIKPGLTEKEVAAELVYHLLKYGADNVSFDPIVVTGSKSSLPHGVPGNKVIQTGDFLTMDFGCKLGGYCSDMTRTVAVGQATDEMKNVYGIVLRAQLKGIAAARAGIAGREIDAAARSVIDEAGYGAYFGHSFGHSLGLQIHEPPNAAPTSEELMPVGAVISAEPGIYLPGRFGVRIEDVLILGENGCRNITLAEKGLIIL